jgi:hypothetical protein
MVSCLPLQNEDLLFIIDCYAAHDTGYVRSLCTSMPECPTCILYISILATHTAYTTEWSSPQSLIYELLSRVLAGFRALPQQQQRNVDAIL